MITKDMKYNQRQKKKTNKLKDNRKKKRNIEGKKPNRHTVYYVCSACYIPASTHILGKQ